MKILSSNGYKVFMSMSEEQALKILKIETIDLVFSDVIMRSIDGYQLSKIISEQYPEIKIQITSGFADIRNSDILDSPLYKARLQKPYTAEELLLKIKEAL